MSVLIKVFLLTICLSQAVFAMTSLDQATKKVIETTQSKVLNARTMKMDGNTIYVIKVLTIDGRVQYIKVDANSGVILR